MAMTKQYAPDDTSFGATEQRKWWKGYGQAPAATAASSAPAAPTPIKPTIETLKSVKNPALAKVQDSFLKDFNLNREAGNKGFTDYLAQANALNAQAKMDLDVDREALDTTAFAKTLAGLRAKQSDKLRMAKDETLKYAAGDRERYDALSGNPGGNSSERENRAISAFLSASLPVEQQILSQEASDAEMLQKLNMGTAGQRSALSQNYLSRLLQPEQARQSMFGSYLNNLSGLQSLDERNTFYQPLVTKPFEPNTPVYNANPVYGAGVVPAVRKLPPVDSGMLNRTAPNDKTPPPDNRNLPRQRSKAEIAYERNFGSYPDQDPGWATSPERRAFFVAQGGRIGGQQSRAALNNYPPSSATPYPENGEYGMERTPFGDVPPVNAPAAPWWQEAGGWEAGAEVVFPDGTAGPRD